MVDYLLNLIYVVFLDVKQKIMSNTIRKINNKDYNNFLV